MRTRLTRLFAGIAALAALAFGGSALAGAANPSPAPPAASVQQGGDVQQGDQAAPDSGAQASESSSEQAESTSEQAESASESVSANDGPGGHADGSAAATLDNQFQGEQ